MIIKGQGAGGEKIFFKNLFVLNSFVKIKRSTLFNSLNNMCTIWMYSKTVHIVGLFENFEICTVEGQIE